MKTKLAAVFLVFMIGLSLAPLIVGAEPPIAPLPPGDGGGPATPPAPPTSVGPPPTTVGGAELQKKIDLLVPIGGAKSIKAKNGPADYINLIFKYALGLAALLALAQLVFGAVQYTTSAGLPSLREDAKSRMQMAIWGLILLLITVVILQTIKKDNFLAGPTIAPIPEIENRNNNYKGSTKDFIERVLSKIDPKKSTAERAKQFMDEMRKAITDSRLSLEERGKMQAEAMRYIWEGGGPFGSTTPEAWKTFGNALTQEEFRLQALSQLNTQARESNLGFDWTSNHSGKNETNSAFVNSIIGTLGGPDELGWNSLNDPFDMYDEITQNQRLAVVENNLAEKFLPGPWQEQKDQAKLIANSLVARDNGTLSNSQRDVKNAYIVAVSTPYTGISALAVRDAFDTLATAALAPVNPAAPWEHQEAEAALRAALLTQKERFPHEGKGSKDFDDFISEIDKNGSGKIYNAFLRPNPNLAVFEGYTDNKNTVLIPKEH